MKFCRDCLKKAGEMFQQHPETISRLWKNYTNLKSGGAVDPTLYNKRKGIDLGSLRVALKEIPIQSCTISHRVAAALGSAKATLLRNLKNIGLRACSRYLKPFLTAASKKERLELVLRWVRDSAGGGYRMHNFEVIVHLDGKY